MSDAIPFFGVAREHRELADAGAFAALEAVLLSGAMLQGPAVAALEARIAARLGRAHGVAIGSCTDGLFFALTALGIGPGDEVLVPALSFIASASCIRRTGATPVFVDIVGDGHIDWDAAAASVTTRTRALLLVQLFGTMTDPAVAEGFAARHGVALVEDFAQGFGAVRDGRAAGSIGAASVTSFDPTKVLSAPGSGGMLVTDDVALAGRVRGLRLHGMDAARNFAELGYNSQLPTLAAALLAAKLDRIDDWRARRARVSAAYCAGLADLPLDCLDAAAVGFHAHHKYVLLSDRRDAIRRALADAGIETRVHYPLPMPHEPMFGDPRAFDAARAFAARALSLPIYPHLRDDEVARIIAAIRSAHHG